MRTVTLILAAASVALTVSGRELVVNGHFDTTVSGWNLPAAGTFAQHDSDGSQYFLSGSGHWAFPSGASNATIVAAWQCIAVEAGAHLAMSAKIRVPYTANNCCTVAGMAIRFHQPAEACGANDPSAFQAIGAPIALRRNHSTAGFRSKARPLPRRAPTKRRSF